MTIYLLNTSFGLTFFENATKSLLLTKFYFWASPVRFLSCANLLEHNLNEFHSGCQRTWRAFLLSLLLSITTFSFAKRKSETSDNGDPSKETWGVIGVHDVRIMDAVLWNVWNFLSCLGQTQPLALFLSTSKRCLPPCFLCIPPKYLRYTVAS